MDAASPFLIDLFLRPFSTSATLEGGAAATAVSVWSYSAQLHPGTHGRRFMTEEISVCVWAVSEAL